MSRRARHDRDHGFTLLEVILSLAILGLALATFGQAVGWSHEHARNADAQTDLLVVAQSVTDELLTGIREWAAVNKAPYQAPANDREATGTVPLVSVAIEAGPVQGLLLLTVRAEPQGAGVRVRDAVTLTQWVVDPELLPAGDSSGSAAGGVP